ncbi:hypothetical protein SLV14_007004 [Streptomyces sp. Je 1-4]|uniref:hypothetical protein n=1 Tax=Streptomyces TaxID=1883 RepID=UPI002180CF31|nr:MULTISPECIES: hypothetical protein [unclassified Streptomyces]UYB43961.1 hypothetical protein SLV14_007004 [Streptomyces sp. Je 1-4]UZQ40386.1 hypothetical protein SLV14N_007004 [Streptomyces sp. Je 1-4] [Streptomyces sp. Je 1-4 4N24]UZQ47803.1 hypothetical protein SLV14NA_007004 [Streptomyces sp. Je 1-4] [Streptomyces sp. Je 1-4 4N24_ara]
MSDIDDRLLALVDGVVDCDEQRLPLLTLREAQAAVELLQLLGFSSGEGSVCGPASGRQPGPSDRDRRVMSRKSV